MDNGQITKPKTLEDIARFLEGELEGPADLPIKGIQALSDAGPEEIAFVATRRHREAARQSRAVALIIPQDWPEAADRPVIRVRDPYLAYARLATAFSKKPFVPKGISPKAHIGEGSRIDPEVSIYPGVYVGERTVIGARVTLHPGVHVGNDVVIGEGSTLYPNSVVYGSCRLGRRVILHAGAVVGSDGFGYAQEGERHIKIPQLGSVVLEDDVEVGANATIDRAAFGETFIGTGTKIDNLVQIGHNVWIGPHSILVAQVGIGGSSRLGRGVAIGGQSGIAGHIELGDRVMVGAQSGLSHSIKSGEVVSGAPAIPHRTWLRVAQAQKRLPDILRELRDLRTRLERLEAANRNEDTD